MQKNDLEEKENLLLNVNEISNNEEIENKTENLKNNDSLENNSNLHKKRKHTKKKTLKQKLILLLKIFICLIILMGIFIYLFFKTSLFQKYKELWVETAMSTMNHQFLATWFLSDEEINEILKKLEVQNNENSNNDDITIQEPNEEEKEKEKPINLDKITGKNYVGYVLTIPNASQVKLVDARKSSRGSKLSELVKSKNALGGINAGGFADDGGVGSGNLLSSATIMNKKLLYGNKSTRYSFIGLSSDSKLVLGKYTYQEALNHDIESAIDFGPYIIVNGKNQITNANSGGIQPRSAIGQTKDGTFIFVVIDGRQFGYSLGTNLLELQNIFNTYGAYNAANLDGGSSATMYYDGKLVNKPSTPAGERYLPNAFIIEKAN